MQFPNSLPGANRESSSRLRYVQYYRLQQRPMIGIHQRDLRPAGIAVVQLQIPVTQPSSCVVGLPHHARLRCLTSSAHKHRSTAAIRDEIEGVIWVSEPLGRRKPSANLLAVLVEELQMGSHGMYSRHILAVDGFIPETSDKADHVTCANPFHLAKGVLPIRSVTESGAGISELHDLRIQEDNIVLPFLLRRRTVRRCDRHPAPVVIPVDLEVFLFRLCSPFVADHDRVGDFQLAQVLRVVHERHHYKRRFVGVSRHAIVVRHHVKVNHCIWLRRSDERNGLESQGYLVEAFEVDRGDFEVLGGITAQMVQRKDVALPLVVVALDCRQHDPWPVPTGLRCRLPRHELGFGEVDCCRDNRVCRFRVIGRRHLANAKGATGAQDGVWPLCRLNRGVVTDIGRNCKRKIVLQRVARDKPVSIYGAFSISLKRLNQVVRPDAVQASLG